METTSSPLSTSSELNNNNNNDNPHFQVPKSSSTSHQMTSKSRSNSLCKSLVIILLLIFVIPLFPSQAPEFVTQRILTDSWEIIHLCLIGLAISYGLFSRKSSDIEAERIAVVHSKHDDGGDYLSGFFFDDGFGELHDGVVQSYANCQCLLTSEGRFIGRDGCVVHGSGDLRSLVSGNGCDGLSVSREKKANQERRLRYSKGESLVVVSNDSSSYCGVSDFKPLNLPIRSLKSVARDSDEEEFEAENRGETSLKAEAKSNCDGNRAVKIRGVIPRNLDNKFEEIAGAPWRSRSVRLQNEEEMMSVSKQICRSRPHSVGEFEFENLESGSFRGSKISSSPEFGRSNSDNAERGDDPRKRLFVSHSKREVFGDDNEESSYSVGKNRSLNSDYVSTGKSFGESEEERSLKSFNLDVKSPALAKVLSKAKSVRTIKPGRFFANGKENKSDLEPKAEIDLSFDNPNRKPSSFHESHEEEKDSVSDQILTESEEEDDAMNDLENHSNDHGVKTNGDDEDCADLGSEVDRKAGEFIAKFREQIRLQKISSARKHSGLRIDEQP